MLGRSKRFLLEDLFEASADDFKATLMEGEDDTTD